MNTIITDSITELIDSLLPHGAGSLTASRLRWALEQVGQVAYSEGAHDALKSLRTTEDAAAAWSVNRQRANAHVRRLHERYAVGMRVGARTWILTQQEIDAHPPARPGRPRKTNSAAAT